MPIGAVINVHTFFCMRVPTSLAWSLPSDNYVHLMLHQSVVSGDHHVEARVDHDACRNRVEAHARKTRPRQYQGEGGHLNVNCWECLIHWLPMPSCKFVQYPLQMHLKTVSCPIGYDKNHLRMTNCKNAICTSLWTHNARSINEDSVT